MENKNSPGRGRTFEIVIVIAFTAVGAWLRFREIGGAGLWLDEIYSVRTAKMSMPELFQFTVQRDVHTPLYYAIVHYWMLLGQSEAFLRSSSAILSVAAIPVMYFAARRLLGVVGAILTLLLVTFSPSNVRYAQEVRMYVLLSLNFAIVLLALAYLITGENRRRWWVTYVVAMVLTMWSHNTAVLAPVAVNAAFLAAWLVARKQAVPELEMPSIRQWFWAQIAVVLLWSVWAPFFIMQARAVDASYGTAYPAFASILATFQNLFSWWHPEVTWILPLALTLLGLGILALFARPATMLFLLLVAVLPFVLQLVASLWRPIFLERSLLWTTMPLHLFLAGAASVWLQRHDRWRLLAIPSLVALGLLLYVNILSLQNYYANFKRDEWREAAAHVAAGASQDDLILHNVNWTEFAFDYYFDPYAIDASHLGLPVQYEGRLGSPTVMQESDVPYMMESIDGYECLWLVYSREWNADPNGIIMTTLDSSATRLDHRQFQAINVLLYALSGAEGSCGKGNR